MPVIEMFSHLITYSYDRICKEAWKYADAGAFKAAMFHQ